MLAKKTTDKSWILIGILRLDIIHRIVITLYILYISVICSKLIDPVLFLSKSCKASQHFHSPATMIWTIPGICRSAFGSIWHFSYSALPWMPFLSVKFSTSQSTDCLITEPISSFLKEFLSIYSDFQLTISIRLAALPLTNLMQDVDDWWRLLGTL